MKIGQLGNVEFRKGTYVYVGSAMNSLESRIRRHLKNDKKVHWHIDYLLKNENSRISDVIYNISDEKIECKLSENISKYSSGIKDFGCSDCNCKSHLYYFKTKKEAIECVKNAYDSIAMEHEFFKK